ncbi:glycosyltransferase [Niabella aurantiaca]|uniref:glycosyltransferase n=1 Tax=Niabella aurantiaca TaxID=379900 RepID=UPI0012F87AE5|nr:glycosyltransferase [Niabella aurantiaca]
MNQIKILQDHYKDELKIDFILLPDRELEIDLGKNVSLHMIKPTFRNSSFLRLFTVFEFTLRALFLLFKLKPRILHVEDMTVVLPVYIYCLFRKKSFKLIYDDHEMPNENESLQYRIFTYFERKLMKRSDIIIFANRERMEILQKRYNLKNRLTYFLNLPYFEDLAIKTMDNQYSLILADIKKASATGTAFIIHQGSLHIERGRAKLAAFSRTLSKEIKLLILGASKSEFINFLNEYQLNADHFYFVGNVPYTILNHFWKVGNAAIVMYLPTYINNRLCAPNRLYIAIKNQLPVLVNRNNPVLNNFVQEHHTGGFIEDIHNPEDVKQLLKFEYATGVMPELIEYETKKFLTIYESL